MQTIEVTTAVRLMRERIVWRYLSHPTNDEWIEQCPVCNEPCIWNQGVERVRRVFPCLSDRCLLKAMTDIALAVSDDLDQYIMIMCAFT